METNWAVEKLYGIIRNYEITFKKMIKEICKLRNLEYNDENISKIKKEFFIDKKI